MTLVQAEVQKITSLFSTTFPPKAAEAISGLSESSFAKRSLLCEQSFKAFSQCSSH